MSAQSQRSNIGGFSKSKAMTKPSVVSRSTGNDAAVGRGATILCAGDDDGEDAVAVAGLPAEKGEGGDTVDQAKASCWGGGGRISVKNRGAEDSVAAARSLLGEGTTCTAATAATSDLFLTTCTPSELASALVRRRFGGDRGSASAFLRSAMEEVRAAEAEAAGANHNILPGEQAAQQGGNDSTKKNDENFHANGGCSGSKKNGEIDDSCSSKTASTVASSSSSSASSLGKSLLREEPAVFAAEAGDGGGKKKAPPPPSPPKEVSSIAPRARFVVEFREGGIRMVDRNRNDVVIPCEAVESAVVFPKPEDLQKMKVSGSGGQKKKKVIRSADLVLLTFKGEAAAAAATAVSYKGKPLSQVCFQLPAAPPAWVKDGEGGDGGDDVDVDDDKHAELWIRVLRAALHWNGGGRKKKNKLARVFRLGSSGGKGQFRSFEEAGRSTTSGGLPFVRCNRGVDDGALFPLREGILFHKPPLFIPRSKMKSISCGGAGGGSYVDVTVVVHGSAADDDDDGGDDSNDKQEVFTSINKCELSVLNSCK